MKRSIQKINHQLKGAKKKISGKLRTADRSAAMQLSVQNSISKWMDRSKEFVSTLPTLNELREEFADWHSFEPIHVEELAQA